VSEWTIGIGTACAFAFGRDGAEVVVADIDDAHGLQVAEQISSKSEGSARFVHLDVTSEDGWCEALGDIAGRNGRLDVLVNAAGILIKKPLSETSFEEWKRLCAVNMDSVFLGTKHASELMRKQGGGAVVNISSTAGLTGAARLAAYCATKGAITMFTKAAALDCARYNVRVNSIHPGYTWTPMTSAYAKNLGLKESEGRDRVGQRHPLGRCCEPDDVANMAVFLASERAQNITGASFVVDGGYTATSGHEPREAD
jgi:NAD(P)-dependent dehydrogenase (short-subunit alcohol dehydrogenase family)